MQTASSAGNTSTEILRVVAEQLKVPLTIIARQAELGQATDGLAGRDLDAMHIQATTALNLVDCYLLGLAVAQGQTNLTLEPVSLSSVITGVAQDLFYFARSNKVDIELNIAGRYGPVMANRKGLRAALATLGYEMVEAVAAEQGVRRRRLTLAVHRTPHGLVAGMYTQNADLVAGHWSRAFDLRKQASQPLTSLSAGSGAGVFVADTILHSIATNLRVGRHRKQIGLAATFQPSKQLAFV